MKKQQLRKLHVNRETILQLEDLSTAKGGAEPASKGCMLSYPYPCNSRDVCLT